MVSWRGRISAPPLLVQFAVAALLLLVMAALVPYPQPVRLGMPGVREPEVITSGSERTILHEELEVDSRYVTEQENDRDKTNNSSIESVTVESSVTSPAPSQLVVLRETCRTIAASTVELTADVLRVMHWVCKKIEPEVPVELNRTGCNKSVVYQSIGRLGNMMSLYSIIFSFSKMFGIGGYVETDMWRTLHKNFPNISLQPTSTLHNITWEDISYQQAEANLTCPAEEANATSRYFQITNYPDRNGIDVFHQFYTEIRREFMFSTELQQQAQLYLNYAKGNRTSATFIGVHVRRTDYKTYILKNYNGTLPDIVFFNKTLHYYRSRFSDALFIICSDDMKYVKKTLLSLDRGDMVTAGNSNIGDPARDMAILSACNHSVVTVGTYSFWGAYLAGGTVLVPEQQTHLSMGDGHAPMLEIQLAGATNWIAIA